MLISNSSKEGWHHFIVEIVGSHIFMFTYIMKCLPTLAYLHVLPGNTRGLSQPLLQESDNCFLGVSSVAVKGETGLWWGDKHAKLERLKWRKNHPRAWAEIQTYCLLSTYYTLVENVRHVLWKGRPWLFRSVQVDTPKYHSIPAWLLNKTNWFLSVLGGRNPKT